MRGNPRPSINDAAGIVTVSEKGTGKFLYKFRPESDTSIVFGNISGRTMTAIFIGVAKLEKCTSNSVGVQKMNVDLALLRNLITKRSDEIEKSVAGTGYLARTVIGIGTFLLDNEGNIDLLTAKQKVIFEKFLEPLLSRCKG
jgi:hypothetical protein